MPELRKDPVLERWVIISTERGKRPTDFPTITRRRESHNCPFCPGNESLTPPEVLVIRDDGSEPNSPGWRLRVISNKYPALRIEGELRREGEGIFDKMSGIGAHEVIIETPEHQKDLVDLPLERITDVIWAYRERTLDLRNDFRFKYVMLFKNQGQAAGASLEHAHSQLIATPVVPKRVHEKLVGARKYFDYKERCLFCDIISQETKWETRVVCQTEHFVALEPFASRFPFETWVLPLKHDNSFTNITRNQMKDLARMLKIILSKLRQALSDPPYNYSLHTDTLAGAAKDHYHWHLEIIPKLTQVAGFEWGTGFYINPVSPEEAAAYLRKTQVSLEVIKKK
ncbi:MAG: galactose-1-phosphate uridylyltransferase [candidate division Zixibacteria bacterium]|nr:galactose-1-phosphate uridylyltransferase [candidate division Zixibacteria bacterium]